MAERFTEHLRQKVGRHLGGATSTPVCARYWRRNARFGEIQVLAATGLRVPHRVCTSSSSGRRTQPRLRDDDPLRAGLLKETLETEMSLHRAYAAEFEIGREELEQESSAPTTRGLHRFFVASSGDGRFRRIGRGLVTLHVVLQRNRPAVGHAARPQREMLCQVDRYVQLKRICRIGAVVSRPTRSSRRRSARA